MLTLWGGGHIGSSRMEQSYCTSGFFRQRVNARNHSNYQPTPKRRSIIAYGNRENARHYKCVAVCVICLIFLAPPFYAFQTFPGRAQLFSRCCCCFLRFKGTNVRQKTYEIFHVYRIFYSGFMCQTTVIFGITKDGSLVLNTLAS